MFKMKNKENGTCQYLWNKAEVPLDGKIMI